MASGRTTKRVQCPGCGQLLRPSRDMLLGRGPLGCECGFGLDTPPPPPLEVTPPPRRGSVWSLIGAGGGCFGAGLFAEVSVLLGWLQLHGAVAGGLAVAGLCVGGWGGWGWWRRRRWFDAADVFEDPAMRRALLTQAREVFERADRNAERQTELFLADRGIHAPEFRAAVLRDVGGAGRTP